MMAERNPETNTVRLLEMASQHWQVGRWAEAEQLCREVLRMDAQHVEALKLLGTIAGSRGELERAIHYFQQALTLLESAETHCNLGLLLRKGGQIAAAAAHYQQAIAIDANFAAAHYSLGKIFH
jgi:tetratricopeptide (TPR) repeat protein